ncbi:hypothetical protein R1flu_019941 [Riccia fluitans]|uniref:Uncharacterized protein n=1 Tax=Riccia fluitans TaxID=41844 RepID=A0ABD1ZKB6_9MARC
MASWRDWRKSQIKLTRDLEEEGRLKYNTVVAPISNSSNRVLEAGEWNMVDLPEVIGFGRLLEQEGSLVRAGIDIFGHTMVGTLN